MTEGGAERAGSKAEPLACLDVLALRPESTAIFLDFDGTLADFSDDPQAVFLPDEVHDLLSVISAATGGALAVVSGRPISDLDRMLAPLSVACAGVHGLERRKASGALVRADVDQRAVDAAAARLAEFAASYPGTLVEEKPGAVALHYRRRPELSDAARSAAEAAAEDSGLALMHGKRVLELKDPRITKAHAIAEFMGEEPFAGRRLVYAGDDVTDEDAFRCVGRWQGLAIKVGDGDTAAAFRARDIHEFRDWLAGLARIFRDRSEGQRRMGSPSGGTREA